MVSIVSIYHKHFKPFSDQTQNNEFISQNEVKRGGEHVKQLIDVTSPTLSMVKVWKYMNGLAKNILIRKFQILCQKFML